MRVPWIDLNEIESRALQLIQLHFGSTQVGHGDFPLDVEDLLDRTIYDCYGFTFLYDNLPPHGNDRILGATDFVRKAVVVHREFENRPNHPRNRFTLSHEIGHVVLHNAYMSPVDSQQELFRGDPSDAVDAQVPVIFSPASYQRNMELRGDHTLLARVEYQANYFAASLMMPRHLIVACMKDQGHSGISRDGEKVVRSVANAFQVSRQAARIRLRVMGVLEDEDQTRLHFSHFGETSTRKR